jgi:predicted nuclease of predicted toxin-antitoxin system
MARFLVDEDLPRSVAAIARRRGLDVVHCVDVGLRASPDDRLLAAAVGQQRVLVTADREFGNILLYPPEQHEGVLLVRIRETVEPDHRIDVVVSALVALQDQNLHAAVVVVEIGRIRTRRSSPRSS